MPSTDTYIEKDSLINEEIDRMRHAATLCAARPRATSSLWPSVSCIYGIGAAEAYLGMMIDLAPGSRSGATMFCASSWRSSTSATMWISHRGTFRVRGDVVEIFPAYERETAPAHRVVRRRDRDDLRGRPACAARFCASSTRCRSFPASHYVTPADELVRAMTGIKEELRERLVELHSREQAAGSAAPVDSGRIYDLEMLEQMGRCKGIENYSRHLAGAQAGRAAAHAHRLFPRRFSAHRRRVPPDPAADLGHAQRRPVAQGNPGGLRLPPALGPRQPAAALRGVGRPSQTGRVRLGHAGRLRGRTRQGRAGRADHPAHRTCSIPRSRCARWARRSTIF